MAFDCTTYFFKCIKIELILARLSSKSISVFMVRISLNLTSHSFIHLRNDNNILIRRELLSSLLKKVEKMSSVYFSGH